MSEKPKVNVVTGEPEVPYTLHAPDAEVFKFIASCDYIVEGEAYWLWQEQAKDSSYGRKRIDWKQDSMGHGRQVATFGGYPIMVTVFRQWLNGIPVCFYTADSLVVHHGAIREWFDTYFPVLPRTNMMNFNNEQNRAEAARSEKRGLYA